MSYIIEYTLLCNKGPVRKINQDNFWCMGEFLGNVNTGLTSPVIGITDIKSFPVLAIFDGMGGEQQGEAAAYIAARTFDHEYNEIASSDKKQFLLNACFKMNKAICMYIKEQHIKSSGTTAAILVFGETYIYLCNIGDSRVYQLNNNKLSQISCDHIENSIFHKKPPLSQYLGIPESDFIIQPYIEKFHYVNGDKYLICSDGLTDMVSEDEIYEIITKSPNLTNSAEALMQKALDAGGIDNITLIQCEIRMK